MSIAETEHHLTDYTAWMEPYRRDLRTTAALFEAALADSEAMRTLKVRADRSVLEMALDWSLW